MITAEIKALPTKDRIILMEELWDTLCHDDDEIESPSWHKEVLNKRRGKINTGKAKLIKI
ncbi:MAG: addiction module protein [Candidatus Auribacterota bacterium]|nr:addiction module protein [Candidatus Auribacterota bacterium]